MTTKKFKWPRKEKKRMKKAAEHHYNTFKLGNLTVAETREIVTLEYVLTWRFASPEELELYEKRYRELSKKRWNE